MRRAAHVALTKVAVQRYHPIETKEATILISALLTNPESREQHIQRTAASAIMSMTYDHPTLTSGLEKAVKDTDSWCSSGCTGSGWNLSCGVLSLDDTHSPEVNTAQFQYLYSHLINGQVCKVEKGSLYASFRAVREVYTIIQWCQNGPCTSCYWNVRAPY